MSDTKIPPPPSAQWIPEEHVAVIAAFLETAKTNGPWRYVVTMDERPSCGVWLKDKATGGCGADVSCYVVAEDELGNFSVVTREGQVRQFTGDEVW